MVHNKNNIRQGESVRMNSSTGHHFHVAYAVCIFFSMVIWFPSPGDLVIWWFALSSLIPDTGTWQLLARQHKGNLEITYWNIQLRTLKGECIIKNSKISPHVSAISSICPVTAGWKGPLKLSNGYLPFPLSIQQQVTNVPYVLCFLTH